MNIIARAVGVMLLTAATTATSALAPAGGASTISALLTYPTASRSPDTTRVFHSHGRAYRFRLQPVMNGNEVYGYDVVMARAGRSFQRNLLDPTGRLHGVQPWQFYAPDFARGPATSTYGGVRTIDRPNLGLSVRLEVVRSVVETAPATHSAPAQPRLTALTVRVVARTEPVGPYRTASPAP